jgi:hypothetical protein
VENSASEGNAYCIAQLIQNSGFHGVLGIHQKYEVPDVVDGTLEAGCAGEQGRGRDPVAVGGIGP